MGNNKNKEKCMQRPIESNNSAAWANKEDEKRVSNVNIPDITQVKNAKEYVDSNQK